MKHLIVLLAIVGGQLAGAANEYPTVTLTQTIGKVKDGKADSSGAYSTTWEGQAPYWPDGIPPGPCTNYVVAANVTLRVPGTSDEGEYPFPGETLLVKGSMAYSNCHEPAEVPFKEVTFASGSSFANWTPSSYYEKSGKFYELHGVLNAPVTILGQVKIKADQNTGCGTIWKGSVVGASDTTLEILGLKGDKTHVVTKEYSRHHVRLESDMSGFLGSIQVETNTIVSFGAALSSHVKVENGGVLENLPGADAAGMAMKTLELQGGSRLSLRLDAVTGAHQPVTVTDSLTVNGIVEVTFKDVPPKTTKEVMPPTKYRVLTFPASANVDESSFVFRGILSERNDYNVVTDTFMAPPVELHVDTDEGAGTKTLYVLVRPRIDLLRGQTGSNYWNTNPDDWSDGRIPHEDADYFAFGKSMRDTDKAVCFTMHSLTVDSSDVKSLGAVQIRTDSVTEFPNAGLFLNWGTLFNYCGGGTLSKPRIGKIKGKVQVGSTVNRLAYFDPANNPFVGFRFLTSFSGGTSAAVALKGSYMCTDDHRSFSQYEFPSNTTGYCGWFEVRTNAVLAIGKDGFPNARATVLGGTLANAAGSIAALSPSDDCVIGELAFENLGAIECRVDPNTGDSGTVKVLNKLTLPDGGRVQVYFSAFPKRSIAAALAKGCPVLTLAAGAEGELRAEAFEVAGLIDTSAGARRIEGAFKVETDEETGDRTLFFVPEFRGLELIFR